jgi:hypothetical protein
MYSETQSFRERGNGSGYATLGRLSTLTTGGTGITRAYATAWFAGRIVQFSLVTCTTQKRLPSGSSNTMKSSSGL